MRKYYIAIIILTIIVLTVLYLGFKEGGSPFTQKSQALDNKRLADMNSIRYRVESYYQQNQSLPSNLGDLSPQNTASDPETKKPYEYKTISPTSYQLCATFSLESQNQSNQYDDIYNPTSSNSHKKGYDCITYTLSSYLLTEKPTPLIQGDWRVLKSSILADFDSYAASADEPRIIVKENSQIKLIYLEDTKIVDKEGKEIEVEEFITGDKVLIDVTMTRASNNFKASRIQNLSR